jgi:hypothetical protein
MFILCPDRGISKKYYPYYYDCLFHDFNNIAAAVGQPVTRLPPHRSRRAELPHRAPQGYSLPQKVKSMTIVIARLLCYPLQ